MTTHADDDGIIDDGPLTELWLTDSPHTVASSGIARDSLGRSRRRISASFFVGFPNKQISIGSSYSFFFNNTSCRSSAAIQSVTSQNVVITYQNTKSAIPPFHLLVRYLISSSSTEFTSSPVNS